jgi:hypothetical protein
MRIALSCLLCAAACSAPLDLGFGVAVTATFDPSVSDAQLASVTQLVIDASGDETFSDDDMLGRAAHRTERFVYRPSEDTRRLALTLTAKDGSGNVIASGTSAQIALVANQTAQLDVTLFGGPFVDGGMPGDTADGATFPTCNGVTYALCEDFEQPLDTQLWSAKETNGETSTDTTHAHSGTHARHVHIDSLAPNDSGVADIFESQTFGAPNVDFHARAFFYFPTVPPGLFALIVAQQSAAPFDEVNAELSAGQYAAFDQVATGGTTYMQSSSVIPTQTWVCLEFAVHFGSPGSLRTAVDGQPLTDDEVDNTTSATPPIDLLLFGGGFSNQTMTPSDVVDFWMDDLVVDPNPIGCAN